MHTSPILDNKDKHSEISQERGIFSRMQTSDIIKDDTGHTSQDGCSYCLFGFFRVFSTTEEAYTWNTKVVKEQAASTQMGDSLIYTGQQRRGKEKKNRQLESKERKL